MNIFEVLNQGNSKLHEPSISAMLGYLLDTRRDHGLGDIFFREFLKILNKNTKGDRFKNYLDRAFIVTDVLLEEPYEIDGDTKYIDIQVSILKNNSNGDRQEEVRIIIENKINVNSVSKGQLDSNYQAVIEDDNIDDLVMIYLTPFSERKLLEEEYRNLKLQNQNHVKSWIKWNNKEDCLIKILKNLLQKESEGEINPINEYTRHTIKAFILFLNSILSTTSTSYRFGEDIGEIIDSIEVKISETGEKYRIIRRDSQQIQVFKNEEKITAKPILRKIIKDKNLKISTSGINTRTMGRKVIKNIKTNY